jgi:glycosyltransferase involved in cell wall biosynthesis
MGMNILLVTRRFPPAPGGVETQVKEIGLGLEREGYQVQIFTTDLYSDIPFRRLSHEPQPNIRRCTSVLLPWRKSEGTSFAPGMLVNLAKMTTPSIVHCHGLNLFAVSASLYIKQLRRCQAICTTHVDPANLDGKLIAGVLKMFDGLVALTEIERRQMLTLGVDPHKIEVIPGGVNVEAFRHLPSRDYFREEYGINGHFILYAGRISFEKGCDILVGATALAQRRIGPCTLVFAGPDWGASKLVQILSQQKDVCVLFTGNLSREDLRAALVACDVFVLPSLKEGLPLSILEAMLCGAPVVSTRVGGIPTLIQDGETGLLVLPKDEPGLADAMCRIVEDRQLSSRLAAGGKELAGKYSIDSTVKQLGRFYSRKLNG